MVRDSFVKGVKYEKILCKWDVRIWRSGTSR